MGGSSLFLTLPVLTLCIVITTFPSSLSNTLSSIQSSYDNTITLGTLSSTQRNKVLNNNDKYITKNNEKLRSKRMSTKEKTTMDSFNEQVETFSILKTNKLSDISTIISTNIESNLLSSSRILQSDTSLIYNRTIKCKDITTIIASMESISRISPCVHGTCKDIVSTITGISSPRCQCDANWIGYNCDISTENILEHCYNGIYEPLLGETDIDCGGSSCLPCAEGLRCIHSNDCISLSYNDTISSQGIQLGSSSAAPNRTVICAADTRVCTANITKPQSYYFYTTLRLGGIPIFSVQNKAVTKSLQEIILKIFLNDPNSTYINDHPEVYNDIAFTRIRSYNTFSNLRRLRSIMDNIAYSTGWRILSEDTGVEFDIEYRIPDNNITTNISNIHETLNTSINNGQLIQYINEQLPTLPVTRVSYEPSATNVLQISDRPAPNPVENENTTDEPSIFSTIGGTIAIICTIFVLIPLAGLSVMAFLGERDANGHTWVDRSLIVYCPCCARSLVKNPVTASAPRGLFAKRKPRSVIVQNPALELVGQKPIQIVEEKKGGPVSAKEFLAAKKAEREAMAASRRPRSSSKSKSNSLSAPSSTTYTSPSGVKRIGGSQPHGVLLDTVKPTVANVVEMMKDTATLGIELGTAYEKGMNLPSPQYGAPNNSNRNSNRTPTNNNSSNNNSTGSPMNNNNNISNNTNNSNATTVRLAFVPDDDDNNDVNTMCGGFGRQNVAKMHRPSIVSSSQRMAFSPDQSRREDDLKPAPSSPAATGRNMVPPSPISSTPLLSGTQGTPLRATMNSSSSIALPPPIPSAIPLGGNPRGIYNSNSQLSYISQSSQSSLNGSVDDSTPNAYNEPGYVPPPDLRGNVAQARGIVPSYR